LAAGDKFMINLSEETEALAQRLALAKRVSVEEVIRLALEEKGRAEGIALDSGQPRDASPKAVAARRARTDRLVAALAAMSVLDRRSPRDIMDDLNAE
jgi:antitoxin VapB